MKPLRRRLIFAGGVIILIYLLGFVVLWLGGGYVAHRSGRTRLALPTPLAIADVVDWQPMFGNCQPDYQWVGAGPHWSGGSISPRCDFIGWAYYPLWIAVKRSHPTFAVMKEDGLPYEVIDPQNLPDGFKFHSIHGEELREVFALINAKAPTSAQARNP